MTDAEYKDVQRREKIRERNDAMRKRSGNVKDNSLLVSFLYELMRDEVTPGKIEAIMLNCTDPDVKYTNGWLARYAKDIANRLGNK